MRWGNWYTHDEDTLMHRPTGELVAIGRLWTPAMVVRVLLELGDKITAVDAAHLIIASNAVAWQAFDFVGVGEWTDESGAQRGAGFATTARAKAG